MTSPNTAPASPADLRTSIVETLGDDWDHFVRTLRTRRIALPIQVRPRFPNARQGRRSLIGLVDATDAPVWGSVAEVTPSRVVPWKTVVRAPRFGRGLPATLLDGAARALIEFAERARALRLHVEVFEPDAFARERLMARFRRLGFRPAPVSRSYERSILIDLRATEEQLLGSFHATCRQNIRAFGKRGLECHPIREARYAARLDDLAQLAMYRTGAPHVAHDWGALIRYANGDPSRAILLGVFRGPTTVESALVGFVLGYRHDDTVEYAQAASARLPDLKAPLLYAATWELMRWGKRHGAQWFDFGGISSRQREGDVDPTAGITRFKRFFRGAATRVGCEMVYAPWASLDLAARFASASASAARRLA